MHDTSNSILFDDLVMVKIVLFSTVHVFMIKTSIDTIYVYLLEK